MSRANMSRANMSRANMSRAYMSGANMSKANMAGADMSKANLSEANLCCTNMRWANMSGADLFNADLFNTKLYMATLTNTCLDPKNTPNGLVDEFEIIDGFVIGYRTRSTSADIGHYQVGNSHSADYFSTCERTECHPGLYLWPTLQSAINYSGNTIFVKVRTKPEDVHKAVNKYRCKWFEVLEEIQVDN